MAQSTFFYSAIFAAFTLTSLLPATLSRSLPETETTSFLDVVASLTRANDVLSFNPESLKPFAQLVQTPLNSSSSFSVQLHPRDALHNSLHKDYKSLTLSRLHRDSARVTSLQLAIQNIKKSDLKPMPMQAEIQPEDLSTPVVSGISQGSGEYFSRIGVGTPAKSFYMVLDTGSDVNWLQCQPCSDCYKQSDPVFDPTLSSTYNPVTCDSSQCQALHKSNCSADKCMYMVSYGDGSYTVGDFVTETVSFGDSGAINNIALGCGHKNKGLFVGAAGLLGLGDSPLSLTTQFKATSFSYCMVNRDSSASSTLEFNSAPPGDSVTAPLLKNDNLPFYYVGLTGFSVGGQPIAVPPSLFQVDESGNGGIIVDSGTAITRLQTEAYNALRDAFKRSTPDLPSASSDELFDTCYDLSSRSNVKDLQVPTVSFLFGGGKTLNLPAENILIPMDSQGKFCFAFAPTSESPSIIGNVQQQGIRVSYDLANKLMGFSPNKC